MKKKYNFSYEETLYRRNTSQDGYNPVKHKYKKKTIILRDL